MIADAGSPLRAVAVLCAVLLTLSLAATAAAQGEPDQPMPAPPADPSAPPPPQPAPPPPGYAPAPPPGAVVALSDRDLKRWLDADPAYRAGKGRRLAGILITTIGGGLSAVFAASFGFVSMICNDVESNSSACSDVRNIAIGSLIGFGVSLAVGIPLWVSGQSQMNEVRRTRFQEVVPVHRPQVKLDLGPRRAGLGLEWRFH